MSDELAEFVEANVDRYRGGPALPLGGTQFGNALSLVAAKAVLENVLTADAYARLDLLGRQLAAALNNIFKAHDLPWHAPQLGGRSGYVLSLEAPRNSDQASLSINYELIDARRWFLSNRGIWDAIASAGPSASFAHESVDIDKYLDKVDEFISEIRQPS